MQKFLFIMIIVLLSGQVAVQSADEESVGIPALTKIEPNGPVHILTKKDVDYASQLLHSEYRRRFGKNDLEVEILSEVDQEIPVTARLNVDDEVEQYYLILFNVWDKNGISFPCRPDEPPRPKVNPCYYVKVIRDKKLIATKITIVQKSKEVAQ